MRSKREQEFIETKTIGKDEMNLAEFPFTLLSKRPYKGQKTIKVQQITELDKNRVIEQNWIVTGSDEFGLPVATDDDTYMALMLLYKNIDFKDRMVKFSRYNLCQIMGIKKPSAKDYKRIEESLNRLVGVTIISRNAFWDNKKKAYVSEGFHLFDSYKIVDEKGGRKGDKNKEANSYIIMSEFLFQSIQASYIKNIDIDFYFNLSNPTSKRLYRFLDKKRYKKSRFEINLFKLAEKLPLQMKYPSQIKLILDKAHQELMEKKFLKSASYEKGIDGEKVVYIFPEDKVIKTGESEISQELMPSKPETSEISQLAYNAVRKFYHLLYGDNYEVLNFSRNDLILAQNILSEYGEEVLDEIIRDTIDYARRSNWEIRSFGAIKVSADRIINRFKREKAVSEEPDIIEKISSQRSEYQKYIDSAIEAHIASLDAQTLENEYQKLEKEFLDMHESTRRWSKEVLRKSVERTYRSRLFKQLKLPTFEEWLINKKPA